MNSMKIIFTQLHIIISIKYIIALLLFGKLNNIETY